MMTARNQPDNLDAYMGLGDKDIVRLVLCLLIEEGLRKQLAAFRAEGARREELLPVKQAS
jgi:hypothetical protein